MLAFLLLLPGLALAGDPPPCTEGACLLCLLGADREETYAARFLEEGNYRPGNASFILESPTTGISVVLDQEERHIINALEITGSRPDLAELFGHTERYSELSARDPVRHPPERWKKKGVLLSKLKDFEIEGRPYISTAVYHPTPKAEKDYSLDPGWSIRTWSDRPASCDSLRFGPEVQSIDVDEWVADNALLTELQQGGWTLVEQGGLPANVSGGGGLFTLRPGHDVLVLVDAPGGDAELTWQLNGVDEETWSMLIPVMQPASAELRVATTLHLDHFAGTTFLGRTTESGPVFWALLRRPGQEAETTLSSLMDKGRPQAPEPTALERYAAYKGFIRQTDAERAELQRAARAEREAERAEREAVARAERLAEEPSAYGWVTASAIQYAAHGAMGTVCVVFRDSLKRDEQSLAEQAETSFQRGSLVKGALERDHGPWGGFVAGDQSGICEVVVR